jgi:hypothetical protein
MVIDATNISRSMRMAFNDPCGNTCDVSIGTLIEERTFLSARGLYRRVRILLLLFEQNNVFSCTWHVAQVKKIIDINVFRCIWRVAQVKNIINILVACRGMCHGVQNETDDSKFLRFYKPTGDTSRRSCNKIVFWIGECWKQACIKRITFLCSTKHKSLDLEIGFWLPVPSRSRGGFLASLLVLLVDLY